MTVSFVADIGGTNARFAQPVNGKLTEVKTYLCQDYPCITDVVNRYMADYPTLTFEVACIGIACPVNGDVITMTNHTWCFSVQELFMFSLDG